MNLTTKRAAAFLAAIIMCCSAFGHYPVCRQTADAKTPSVRDFADSVLQALPERSGTAFESLCYQKGKNRLLCDGEPVSGNSVSGFRVIDGELMVAASETVRAGETASQEYLSLEEAAPLIGLETYETDEGLCVSDPFRSGTLIVKSGNLSDTMGASELGNGWNDLHVLQYPTAADAYAAYQAYQNDDGIIFAEPNRVYHIAEAEKTDASDHEFPSDNWGWPSIGADSFLTQYGETAASGQQVVAAVLDTGLYYGHNWFRNRIAENGASFIAENESSNEDLNGHGTHCAGIICGMTPENVKILPLKVLNHAGSGETLGIYCAMLYAAEQNADVVSMSLGGFGSSPMFEEAVSILKEKNIPCVVAAGNAATDAKYYTPANIPDAITVCSLSHKKDYLSDEEKEELRNTDYWLSSYSNFGNGIDFGAPGESITSAYLSYPDNTAVFDGTSMACPHVAGCVADILSVKHDATFEEVYDILKENAQDLGDAGFDEKYGWGMVNIADLDFKDSSLAQPEASADPGIYTDIFSVTLSTPEPDAAIRYTLDGTIPEADTGILYQGEEILIDNTTELCAVTVKDGDRSRCTRCRYTFYADSPAVTPESGYYNDSVYVDLTGAENRDVYYTLDGSDPDPENGIRYTGPFQITEPTVLKVSVVIGKYVSEPCVRCYSFYGQKPALIFDVEDGVLKHYYGTESNLDLNDHFAPGEITKIGSYAFQPEDADSYNPAESIRNIVLPESVTLIGAYAFSDCKDLRTITAPGVETVEHHCFENCWSIISADMPALKTVKQYAFANSCSDETEEPLLPEDNQIEVIEPYGFECCKLVKASFPNLKSLGKGAFGYCYSLKSVSLSPDITKLPASAFCLCDVLSELDAPGVTELGDYALCQEVSNDPVLTSWNIDFSKLTSIGTDAISMFKMEPESHVSFDALTSISYDAFKGFKVRSISLPALKKIPAGAFLNAECSAVYLEQAEHLDVGALTPNPVWENRIVYIFGDRVAQNQRNPLESGCDAVTVAAPADSPMKLFAQAAGTAFYSTPDIYIPSGFGSVRQYDLVSLNECIPLAFGCEVEWSAVSAAYDAGYQEPDQLLLTDRNDNTAALDTTVPGTVTLQADLVDDAGNILTSKTQAFRISPRESADIMTEEGVFLVEWSKGDVCRAEPEALFASPEVSGKYSIVFIPEEDGEYYFVPETFYTSISVYNSRNEQIGFTGSWVSEYEMTAYPVSLKAGEVVHVTAETKYFVALDNLYSGILISSQLPVTPVNNYCVTLDRELFSKETENSVIPSVSIENPYYYGWDTDEPEKTDDNECQIEFVRKGDSASVFVFGKGSCFGCIQNTVYYYDEYTPGETLDLPEISCGEYLCYHFKNTDSMKQFMIGMNLSDAYLRKYDSGEITDDPFACLSHVDVYDSLMVSVRWGETNYSYFDEKVYTLEPDEDYYIMLCYSGINAGPAWDCAPAGMYSLISKEYDDPNCWFNNCEIEVCESKRYSGSRMDLIRRITDQKGNILTEGNDYEVFIANGAIPGEELFIVKGIGDYYGSVTEYSEIWENYLKDGPYTPEQIRVNEPFRINGDCGYFELETDNTYLCKLRKTDASDPDVHYFYSIDFYDTEELQWVTYYNGNDQSEDSALELRPGSYRIYLSQKGKDQEYIFGVQDAWTSVSKADVQVKALYYTGEELTPELTLTYNGTTLTEGTDYILIYPDTPIIACGIYDMKIAGIGSFSAERTVHICVKEQEQSALPKAVTGDNTLSVTVPGQTAGCEWIAEAEHYGIQMNELLIASLSVYDAETNKEVCSLKGNGYLCGLMDVTPGKTYQIFASWLNPNQTGDIRFGLHADCTDLRNCTAEGPSQIMFTEHDALPAITVKDGETVLREGTDYEVYYSGGNKTPGHAVISLIGTGAYIGELKYHYYLCPDPDEAEQQTDKIILPLNEAADLIIQMPGDMEWFEFEAPADGTYQIERPDPEYSGVCVFAYGPDGGLLPLDAQSADMKKGETLRFYAVFDHVDDYVNQYADYRLAVSGKATRYEVRADDFVYIISDGQALIDRYEGKNAGFLIPETVYDPETDTEIPLMGITSNLTESIGLTKTIYCERDSALYGLLRDEGFCVADPEPQTDIRGDITGDGIVNNNDWLTLMRCINECPGMIVNESVLAVADMNKDGCLDLLDANAIKEIAAAEHHE